jgi:glutamate dehydrogenase (NADP+)
MLHGPYRATTVGGTLFNGMSISDNPLQGNETMDSRVENGMIAVYDEIKRTAKEFNTRGDLQAGANIASFLRVADAMLIHGSV